MVFLLQGWRRLFELQFVVTFRHPLSVAESLTQRAAAWNDKMTTEHAIQLWNDYNRMILTVTEHIKCPVVEFGTQSEAYVARLRAIATLIGLRRSHVSNFFDPDISRNTTGDLEAIPESCQSIWLELTSRASAFDNLGTAHHSWTTVRRRD